VSYNADDGEECIFGYTHQNVSKKKGCIFCEIGINCSAIARFALANIELFFLEQTYCL